MGSLNNSNKGKRGASSLLGRMGAGGLGAGAPAPTSINLGAHAAPKPDEHATKPTKLAPGQSTGGAGKHSSKPETRRPPSRAVSGS